MNTKYLDVEVLLEMGDCGDYECLQGRVERKGTQPKKELDPERLYRGFLEYHEE